jgi:tetratricopeptide (TPR) repeat protein
MNPPLSPSSGRNPLIGLAAVCALVLAVFWGSGHSGLVDRLGGTAAGSSYNLLIKGFQDGQLGLKKAVPPGLAQLANPYDPGANEPYRAPPTLADDLSFYRGKFYLYFGLTPALLLFWPWTALTGSYLPHWAAVAVFCSVGFLASVALLRALGQRYFPETSPWIAASGALALGLATSAPILLQRAEVYEVAISCAYALTMLALGAVWLALHRPSERIGWLAAASLAFGLAVGARPPVLFSTVVLILPIAAAWSSGEGRGERGRLLLAAAGPLALCGLGLAAYNTLRFGSPLEFGQNYQISGTQQNTAQHFSLGYLWFDFRIYFLEPMRWHAAFPFVRNIVPPPLPPGEGIVEVPFSPFGILTNIPLVWLALAAPLAGADWRAGQGTVDHRPLRWFLSAAAILFVIPAAVICLFFGTCSRYEMEFLPVLVLLAVIGIFGLEKNFAGRPRGRAILRCLWIAALVFSVAFNLLAGCERYALEDDYAGQALTHLNRLPDAIAEFRAALRMDPRDSDCHEDLGIALARSGEIPAAAAEFRAALRWEPGRADAHDNLGNALVQLGQNPAAIAEFREGLRLRPESAAAHYNLAVALQRAGLPAEAAAEYREAIRLNPGLAPRTP